MEAMIRSRLRRALARRGVFVVLASMGVNGLARLSRCTLARAYVSKPRSFRKSPPRTSA